MARHRFTELDVFASGPFSGNPLAVVHDAAGIDADEMLRITRWLNLSETTFLVPPTDSGPEGADYGVRIFYPAGELPFAGHPTLGSCAAWLAAGGRPKRADVIVQECGIGLVPIRRAGDRLAFAAPPLRRSGPVDAAERDRVTSLLGLDPATVLDACWGDNGPAWMIVRLVSAAAVLAVPVPADLGGFEVGLVGAHPAGADPQDPAVEVRAFFTNGAGMVCEDPVTGSLNASLALVMTELGVLRAPYVAAQGTAMGRDGRVHVDADADGTLWIGGDSTVVVTGEIER
ncbi:MAG: PhzF family phenazine biosynthesis protein [Acidimicrobiia bacterium]|nr:PhzF family phenazine biosynthesis protein [Acidimicrobiia bacterium]